MRLLKLIIFVIVLSATTSQTWGKEFDFAASNCACAVPDAWVSRPGNEALIDISDIEGKKSFVLTVFPATQSAVEMSHAPNIKAGMAKNGFTAITAAIQSIQNVKFRKVGGTHTLGDKSYSTTVYVGVADGHVYWLTFSKSFGPPDQDAEMMNILSSFHFLKPPVIPEDNYKNHLLAIGLLILSIGAGFILFLGWGLYFLIRYFRKKAAKSDEATAHDSKTDIFIFRPEGNLGPFTFTQLASELISGTVTAEDLGWQEGMTEWAPLSRLPRPEGTRLPDPETVTKRNRLLPHESQLRSLSIFYLVGGNFILFFGICLLIIAVFPLDHNAPLYMPVISLAVGGFFTWVGLLFKHLDRRAIVAGAIATALGMLIVPIGTLIGIYILNLIFSKKGKFIFSKSYRQIIKDTPHIHPKTSTLVMVLLAVVIIFVMSISITLFIQSISSVVE